MAELSPFDRKSQLIAELAQSRREIMGHAHDTGVHLDSARSLASHKALWLGAAAAGGWLFARLSGKKKPKAPAPSRRAAALTDSPAVRSGWLLALLGSLFTLLRPTLTSYLTHRLNDYLTRTPPDEVDRFERSVRR